MDEIGGDPGAHLASGGWLSLLDQADQLIARAGQKYPLLGQLLARFPLTARGLLLALLGLVLLLALPPLIGWLLRRCGRLEANFRGERIPQSYGLVILLWAGTMLTLAAALFPADRREILTWLIAVVGFGTLGFVDDTWGDRCIKGLRGHFRAALRGRTFTTGFLKAVGGALLALGLGFRCYPVNPALALLAAALIALSANVINLLDLRPGRAGAVFLLGAALLLAYSFRTGAHAGVPPLLYVALPTLLVYERDARARVMMGDVGSNLLGACLGLALAASPASPWTKLIALLGLVGLHLLAERASLTALIEKNPTLRALDRLTGVR
ncbi:MAG TPA: hypothetical protein VFB38_14370 [Chthonomonadaceae bacterium]|nr:hypothetical protein [Chthonomonadaceae bacterium]